MTPTPRVPPPARSMTSQVDAPATEHNALLQPSRTGRDGRSLSAASIITGTRGQSFAASGPPPGSFSSELRFTASRSETPRPDFIAHPSFAEEDSHSTSEQRQAEIQDQIDKETKIK